MPFARLGAFSSRSVQLDHQAGVGYSSSLGLTARHRFLGLGYVSGAGVLREGKVFMRILIIGGTRFLGVAIARELVARGNEATVFHRGATKGDLPAQVVHVLGDVRDRAALESAVVNGGFDAVVDTILDAETLQWLLPVLRRSTSQLVHCGSTGVYAPASAIPVREDDPTPCPPELGGFGTKLRQDEVLLSFYRETGFKTCSLCVSNVFGAGDVPLDIWGSRQPAYFRRLACNKPIWIPNDGRALLQPVHTADLARGFCAALESDRASGQIYNLSSDRAVTLTHYAEIARDILGSSSSFAFVPVEEILATGKANESGLRFVCEHMSIDSSKARRDLGYEPRIGVRQGLADSLQWMAQVGLLEKEFGPSNKSLV